MHRHAVRHDADEADNGQADGQVQDGAVDRRPGDRIQEGAHGGLR